MSSNKKILDISLNEVLKELKKENQTIVFLDSEASAMNGLKLLDDNGILSAPVLDHTTNKCLGIVGILDFASFARSLYYENEDQSNFKNYLLQFSFDLQKVKDIMDLSKKNPFVTLKSSSTIREAIKIFASGVHRICIVDDNEQVKNIISQTDLFKFMFGNSDSSFSQQIKSMLTVQMKKSVKELNLGRFLSSNNEVYTVKQDTIAMEAFKFLTEKRLNGIGIVDQNQNLVGQITASDLRGFIKDELPTLAYNVLDFKQFATKKRQVAKAASGESASVVTCHLETTLEDLASRILKHRAHRVFVVKDHGFLDGVISLTDVFSALTSWLNEDSNN